MEDSTKERAEQSGEFVQKIHEKVVKVKNNEEMEVELMTLLGKREAILDLSSEYGEIPEALMKPLPNRPI